MAGLAAAGLLLAGCGDAQSTASRDTVPTPASALPSTTTPLGDQAVWLTPEQVAELRVSPPDTGAPISAASSSFTAHVMRVACSGGRTGTVLAPSIVWSDTRVVVTFSVEPLPQDPEDACPPNDTVAYVVELGQPIGQRQLFDGACASNPAASTTFCTDGGVRWRPDGADPERTTSTPPPSAVVLVPPTSAPPPVDAAPPTLDLGGVTSASVPMAISEHLESVQQFVRAEVGDDVFAGAAFTNLDNDAMTVYGTDTAAIASALDRVDTPLRDHITIAETRYSLNQIERYAADARARLDAAGIEGSAGIEYGVDAVVVWLQTPDGAPDAAVESAALDALGDIPVSIEFQAPMVEL